MRNWPHLETSLSERIGLPLLRGIRSRLLIAAFIASVATIGPAQEPTLKTRPKEERDREYLERHRITINVQVNDGDGKPVPNLTAGDFALFDDQQPRRIAAMHEIDGQAMYDATEIVIVLDAVNSTAQELEAERNGIFRYLAQSKAPLPYPTSFVLWFNGHLKASAATTDRNVVGRAFVKMTKDVHSSACTPVDGLVAQVTKDGGAGADGRTRIGDPAVSPAQCMQVHFRDSIAALEGIAAQQRSVGGRTILIWIGPGWPLLSYADLQRSTPKARQSFFDETVNLRKDLQDAQVMIDALSPRDGTREAEMPRVDMTTMSAGASAQNVAPSSVALEVLARETGGRVLDESNDITADLVSCIHDADEYYILTFEMMHATAPHEFHPVEVKVNRPGAQVRTITEYYAEP
jgi:VWFA-related protein